jgi:hypothetical protein
MISERIFALKSGDIMDQCSPRKANRLRRKTPLSAAWPSISRKRNARNQLYLRLTYGLLTAYTWFITPVLKQKAHTAGMEHQRGKNIESTTNKGSSDRALKLNMKSERKHSRERNSGYQESCNRTQLKLHVQPGEKDKAKKRRIRLYFVPTVSDALLV